MSYLNDLQLTEELYRIRTQSFYRPKLKELVLNRNTVMVTAPDSLSSVELTVRISSKQEANFFVDESHHIGLKITGTLESSFTTSPDYFVNTSWSEGPVLGKNFYRDQLLLTDLLKEDCVLFEAKVFNSAGEGNIDYLIREAIVLCLKNCTLGKDVPLGDLFNTSMFPFFYYYVLINGYFVLNPTRVVSTQKEGILVFYKDTYSKKLLNLKYLVWNVEVNKTPLDVLRRILLN